MNCRLYELRFLFWIKYLDVERYIEGFIKCEQTNEERLRLFLDCFIVWETRMLNTCLCYEIIPLPYL